VALYSVLLHHKTTLIYDSFNAIFTVYNNLVLTFWILVETIGLTNLAHKLVIKARSYVMWNNSCTCVRSSLKFFPFCVSPFFDLHVTTHEGLIFRILWLLLRLHESDSYSTSDNLTSVIPLTHCIDALCWATMTWFRFCGFVAHSFLSVSFSVSVKAKFGNKVFSILLLAAACILICSFQSWVFLLSLLLL